jgi:cytochrome c-type biogenesis protein CcmH
VTDVIDVIMQRVRSAIARWSPKARFGRAAGALALTLALAGPAHAVQPGEVLDDPGLETRARGISAGLRCLVCQNQSIDDSDAPLAKDLRVLVRERLKAGESDKAVLDYIVQRYGDFVLLRPPLNVGTALLWLSPLLLLLAAGVLAVRHWRGSGRPIGAIGEAPLSAEEARRLDEILKKAD